MSSGSSSADSAVEPTRSTNITVSWRRSAAEGRGPATRGGGDMLVAGPRAAMASSSFFRWPSDETPMSLRSSAVSRGSSSASMSLARNSSAYWGRPISRSQSSIRSSVLSASCPRRFRSILLCLSTAARPISTESGPTRSVAGVPLRWSNLARDAPTSAHRFSMNPDGAVRKRQAAPSHYGRRPRLAPTIRLPSRTLELTSWLATGRFWQPRVPPSI